MRFRAVIIMGLLAAACSTEPAVSTTAPAPVSTTTSTVEAASSMVLVDSDGSELPPPPEVPDGPLAEVATAQIEAIWSDLSGVQPEDIEALGAIGDPRIGWLLSDLLRFYQGTAFGAAGVSAFNEMTGAALDPPSLLAPWGMITDVLIAWDVPAPPGYADYKRRLFTLVEPGWQPFFEDEEASVDWRLVSWGGVLIDDRPLGDPNSCLSGCIPALDDPRVTSAAEGAWYPDDSIVFALELNGESRAYPKNMMEVHEMVNDTLGGRRIGMPYCTLCGSAQAFLTDDTPDGVDSLILRTSGLLARSNKVMYDLGTHSMFDTFLGEALTGPLRQAGYVLEPVPVVTTTWGDWKAAHPETTIVAQDGGLGRTYPDDPLRGRDDNGPIFPIGDVDQRLGVQEQVLGVVAPDGTAVAFPVSAAQAALQAGDEVALGGVELTLDGGGLRAAIDGAELGSHQAFWFAWSQFRPETLVWGVN
jgi:hypothetical protein